MREPRPASSGTTEMRAFHYEGVRSLGAAVDALVCRHGLFINYEDAPWIAAEDIAEPAPAGAARSASGAAASGPRVRIPAGERLDFEYADDPQTQLPVDAHGLLESLVDEHRAQGGHGRFRVERLNDGIASIVPLEARDRSGSWRAVEPVLSLRVTIEAERRTVEQLFDRVLAELNRSSPYRIGYGAVPLNAFHQTTVDFGSREEPAREVLVRALRALPYRYYMRMNFDPMSRSYFLNVVPPQPPELCSRPSPS